MDCRPLNRTRECVKYIYVNYVSMLIAHCIPVAGKRGVIFRCLSKILGSAPFSSRIFTFSTCENWKIWVVCKIIDWLHPDEDFKKILVDFATKWCIFNILSIIKNKESPYPQTHFSYPASGCILPWTHQKAIPISLSRRSHGQWQGGHISAEIIFYIFSLCYKLSMASPTLRNI